MSQDGLYHGCWTVFKDGIRCLIKTKLGEQYLMLTNDPFWTEDVGSRVKTMSQEMDMELASNTYIKNYFKKLFEQELEREEGKPGSENNKQMLNQTMKIKQTNQSIFVNMYK